MYKLQYPPRKMNHNLNNKQYLFCRTQVRKKQNTFQVYKKCNRMLSLGKVYIAFVGHSSESTKKLVFQSKISFRRQKIKRQTVRCFSYNAEIDQA